MLGDVLGESKGRRMVRRVLSSEPLRAEVSFEDAGNMLGVATNGMGTYTSEARTDGSLYGEGQGAMITADGEAVTWRGSGTGKLLAGGAVSYRGIPYYRAPSQKLERLNNACAVFEYEVDAAGNTTSKVWEWKWRLGDVLPKAADFPSPVGSQETNVCVLIPIGLQLERGGSRSFAET